RIHSLENLPRPQLGIVALLRSATDIQLNGQRGDVSIAPEQNLVHTKVERLGWVSALKWDLRGDMAIADWHFLWTPPRTGLLNVLSALSMNGWGFAYPGPGCIKGSSSWSIDAGIVITQLGLNGEPLTDSVQMRVDEQSFDSSDFPSSGGVILTANTLDSITALSYQNQYVALAQVPMIITVSAILYVLVAHGEAELNFMDGDFQLNVPFVYLFLD
ncbi:MAG: hypothetical protein ICV84_18185, partial [Flavisolibacter sp.]|nr:hypothetical protein [Flavisolibacter sp.]